MDERYFYVVIESPIIYDTRLNSTQKLLYGVLTCMSKKSGSCYASTKYLCKIFNFTRKQLLVNIKKLKELGYLKVEINSNKRIVTPLSIENMKNYPNSPVQEFFDYDWIHEKD